MFLILSIAFILRLNGIWIDVPTNGGGSNELVPINNAPRLFKTKKFDFFITLYYIEEEFVSSHEFIDLYKDSEPIAEFVYEYNI